MNCFEIGPRFNNSYINQLETDRCNLDLWTLEVNNFQGPKLWPSAPLSIN